MRVRSLAMTTLAAPPTPATWSITQEGEVWQARHGDTLIGNPQPTYQAAVELVSVALGAHVLAEQPNDSATGVLAEAWHSPSGIAFSEPTGDGRDFSQVRWSWRDPDTSLLPLMFQTKTDMGHFGAELAGYITTLAEAGGVVSAQGHFYDSDMGRQARDLLLGGRRFGVSVDPGAVEASWECVAEDDDGWCTEERINFDAYEVIGLTMTPFPAFANASIELAGGQADLAVAAPDHAFTDDNGDGNCDACLAEDDNGNCTQVCDLTEAEHTNAQQAEAAVAASATLAAPLAPPRAWFEMPEPMGDPADVEWLVDQGDGSWAVPLTILDSGQVFGHVARWGQCHTGYPGACVTPPHSASGYQGFHVGSVRLAEGDDLAVGCLTVAADHAPSYLRAAGAADHYAHTGLAWADVRATDGEWGIWICGSLRPEVQPELLRVLRASTPSGDWRGGEMVAVLSVNTPGFPISREAITASGAPVEQLPDPVRPQARLVNGEAATLVAAGTVRRCADCARKGAQAATHVPPAALLARQVAAAVLAELRPELAALSALELRTRHLRNAQRDATRARLTRPAGATVPAQVSERPGT